MRLGFMFFLGVFTNLLLASVFPYQLLPSDVAQDLVGTDTYNYDLNNNGYFGTDYKTTSSQTYSTLRDESQTSSLLNPNEQESSVLESVSFFDGLTDALTKAGQYLSLIIPFSTVLFLLPGAFGLILGGVYTGVIIYAVIRFIRGA